MFFGLDFEKLILIGVLAAMIIGPQRLPAVAQSLARFAARAREWGRDGKARLKEELGDDFDDVEWRKLDPRQYDPRRIIRNALLEPVPSTPSSSEALAAPPVADTAPRITVQLDPISARPTPGAALAVAPEPAGVTEPVTETARPVEMESVAETGPAVEAEPAVAEPDRTAI